LFITWDKHHPYGCHDMGFKSKVLPATEVFAVNGSHCLAFKPKPTSSTTQPASPGNPTAPRPGTKAGKHLGQHINIKG
jgi:hypothetical protein